MTTKRYLVVGLALSVMVNLVLIGFFAGRATLMSGTDTDRGMKGLDPTLGIRPLIGDLSEPRREELEPLLKAYFSALRPRFREIRGTQQSLKEAILSEPLNRSELRSTLEIFNYHLFQTQEQAQDALVDLAAAMSLEERRKLVTYLERPPRREHLRRPPRENPQRQHLSTEAPHR